MAYVEARQFSTGADIIAAAKGVRARLWKPGKAVLDNQPVPQKPAPAPIPDHIIEEKKRLQRKQKRNQEKAKQKREAEKAARALIEPEQPKTFPGTINHDVVQHCIARRVWFHDVVGKTRSKKICEHRYAIMCSVYKARMDAGNPIQVSDIGRLFNRDYKTVIYALRQGGVHVAVNEPKSKEAKYIYEKAYGFFVQIPGFQRYRNLYFGCFKTIEEAKRMRDIAVSLRDSGWKDPGTIVTRAMELYLKAQPEGI